MAAKKPWYYVPGRKDLTEKRICRRREREARYHQTWSNANDYFARFDSQNKLFKNWEENRPLVHYPVKPGDGGEDRGAPFDVLVVESPKTPQEPQYDVKTLEKRKRVNAKLRSLLLALQEKEKEADTLRDIEVWMSSQVKGIQETQVSLSSKIDNWKLKENKLSFVRSARDRLRQKTFLVIEQLHYFKITIQCLSMEEEEEETILAEEEGVQLKNVLSGALRIIDMYLEINSKRNTQFLYLFHEEAEECWPYFEKEWEREAIVWSSLMSRMLDTFLTIFTTKLEENVGRQEILLEKREASYQALSSFMNTLKADPSLASLLSQSLSDLID